MPSFTLENAFMLTVFQVLVSGLLLSSSLAIFYKEKAARPVLGLVAAAFSFYSLYFILRAFFAYRSLSLSGGVAVPGQWELLLQVLEKVALGLLGASFFLACFGGRMGKRSWAAMAAAFILLSAMGYLAGTDGPGVFSPFSGSALANGVWLAVIAGFTVYSMRRKGLVAGTALVLLAAAQFLYAASRISSDVSWAWIGSNTSLLAGLGLLALAIESFSTNLPTRFFLRLNLIFIAVASMLILTVAEMERREYLLVAEQNAQELQEFLRGQVIYSSYNSVDPREVLSSPELVGKVTADFARLPDLRRVRVTFEGWTMEMAIGDDWLVSHQVYRAAPAMASAKRTHELGRIATLTPVSIESRGKVLGSIEVDHSLLTINSQVARHMRIIFLTFTAAVFIAAGLFGVTVQYAHRTIQRQFQELEKASAQLLHAERLASVGRLAGGVAHEINNPAGIILTTSDYLLRESDKQGLSESFRESLQAIRRQAWRVSEIVNGLLAFSRPTKLRKQPVDINAVLQHSLALLAPRFRDQRIQLDQKLAHGLPMVAADPDRMEQVFVNLLNNAADAMPQGGQIGVETQSGQHDGQAHLMVSIADSGTGIDKEHLNSIFEPFFSTKARGKGTGLGLSVSHGIIRDHSGRIEAESGSGQGAIFRIYLPLGGVTP
jgi:signal transduction histidine kinase